MRAAAAAGVAGSDHKPVQPGGAGDRRAGGPLQPHHMVGVGAGQQAGRGDDPLRICPVISCQVSRKHRALAPPVPLVASALCGGKPAVERHPGRDREGGCGSQTRGVDAAGHPELADPAAGAGGTQRILQIVPGTGPADSIFVGPCGGPVDMDHVETADLCGQRVDLCPAVHPGHCDRDGGRQGHSQRENGGGAARSHRSAVDRDRRSVACRHCRRDHQLVSRALHRGRVVRGGCGELRNQRAGRQRQSDQQPIAILWKNRLKPRRCRVAVVAAAQPGPVQREATGRGRDGAASAQQVGRLLWPCAVAPPVERSRDRSCTGQDQTVACGARPVGPEQAVLGDRHLLRARVAQVADAQGVFQPAEAVVREGDPGQRTTQLAAGDEHDRRRQVWLAGRPVGTARFEQRILDREIRVAAPPQVEAQCLVGAIGRVDTAATHCDAVQQGVV